MKSKKLSALTICLFLAVFTSCVTISDRPIHFSERDELEIIGRVETTFTQWQPFHAIRRNNILYRANSLLLEQAKFGYGYDVDVRNVRISGSFSPHNAWLIPAGNAAGFFLGFGLMITHAMFNQIRGVGYTGSEWGSLFLGFYLAPVAAGNIQTITARADVVIPRAREEE